MTTSKRQRLYPTLACTVSLGGGCTLVMSTAAVEPFFVVILKRLPPLPQPCSDASLGILFGSRCLSVSILVTEALAS